jgi:hypothetical protein
MDIDVDPDADAEADDAANARELSLRRKNVRSFIVGEESMAGDWKAGKARRNRSLFRSLPF